MIAWHRIGVILVFATFRLSTKTVNAQKALDASTVDGNIKADSKFPTQSNEICTTFNQSQIQLGVYPTLGQAAGTFSRHIAADDNVTACVELCCHSDDCHIAFLNNGHECANVNCHSKESCKTSTAVVNGKHAESMFVWVRNPKVEDEVVETVQKEKLRVEINGPTSVQLTGEGQTVTFLSNLTGHSDSADIEYTWTITPEPSSSAEVKTVMRRFDDPTIKEMPTTLNSDDWTQPTLIVHDLVEGKFDVAVSVTATTAGGAPTTAQNRTELEVLPEVHENGVPVAVITPEHSEKADDDTIVLDAAGSTDPDNDALTYHWRAVGGPSIQSPPVANGGTYQLEKLTVGNYTFGLVVTDSHGAKSEEAIATVSVTAARDDKPAAVVNQCDSTKQGDFTVVLPLENIYLCGNESTDDKGIVSYRWNRLNPHSTAITDTQGMDSAMVTMSHFSAGTFEFELTVVDAADQTDTKKIAVHVLPQTNLPPVARTSPNVTRELQPEADENYVVLDATTSSDDGSIVSTVWSQISGPINVTILKADTAKATATNLISVGVYDFRVNVTDDHHLSSAAVFRVNVTSNSNKPPVIVTQNVTVHLPSHVTALNACLSTDDAAIMQWTWTAAVDNQADMKIVSTSADCAAYISYSTLGISHYNITACDVSKACTSAIVSLTVLPDDSDEQAIHLIVDALSTNVTNKRVRSIGERLSAVIGTDVQMVVHDVYQMAEAPTTRLMVHFVSTATADGQRLEARSPAATIFKADVVVAVLIAQPTILTNTSILSVRAKYCTNTCSSHGACDNFTHRCVCHPYWMPNLFKTYLLQAADTCEWSTLYFLLSCAFISIGGLIVIYTYACHDSPALHHIVCRVCCGLRVAKTANGAANRRGASRRQRRQARAKRRDYRISSELETRSSATDQRTRQRRRSRSGTSSSDSMSDVLFTRGKEEETRLLVDVEPTDRRSPQSLPLRPLNGV